MRILVRLFGIPGIVMLLAGLAAADPITAGTNVLNFNPIGTVSQGTISGYFSVNATGGTLSYDFLETASADCCGFNNGFGSFEFLPTNTGASSALQNLANGDQEFIMNATHSFGGSTASVLVVQFLCGGVTNCFTNNIVNNNAFMATITEFGMPDGSPERTTGTVFLNVTDDPGVFSFNAAAAQAAGTTLIGGTGDGGNPSSVPEPSALLLLGSGLAASAGTLRKRLKSTE